MKNLQLLIVLLLASISTHSFCQVKYFASNRVLNAVNCYEENGDYIEEFIEQDTGGLNNPQDIVLHPDGFLLVTGSNNEQILKFDLETGAFLGFWSDPSFALGRPSKMSIGPDNLLYVTQWGQTATTSKIVRFDMDGTYLGPFTPTAPTGLGHVWDADGNFYLAIFGITTGSGNIRKYDTNGAFVETFIDSTILENPTYIWWDTNGDMLVQDFTAGKVLRYDANGDYIGEFITGLSNPEGYLYLPNGHLLISERGANQITEYNANGALIGRWDNGGTLAGPNFIVGIDTNLLVDKFYKNSMMVTPSWGTSFALNNVVTQLISSILVYDIRGSLVTQIHAKDKVVWDASSLNEGIYLLISQDRDGRKFQQKIVVKK